MSLGMILLRLSHFSVRVTRVLMRILRSGKGSPKAEFTKTWFDNSRRCLTLFGVGLWLNFTSNELLREKASVIRIDPLGLCRGGHSWVQCVGIACLISEENQVPRWQWGDPGELRGSGNREYSDPTGVSCR
jgi:hypothetical protein